MNEEILVLDDDILPTRYYIYALELRNWNVVHKQRTEDAISSWELSPPALLILDVMMPPGRPFEKMDTEDGLITGLYVYRQFRTAYESTPVVVLTHALSAGKLFQSDSLLKVVRKAYCSPIRLADLVEQMLSTTQKKVERR
jgi:CheY-like chemotaxis protein